MEDVAAACGVTKLIVYRHFETKEELYRAILQRVLDRSAEELNAGLSSGSTRGLGARLQLTVAREDPDAYILLWRHAAREPRFADYIAGARDLSIEVVRQLLAFDSGDAVLDHWQAEVLLTWLVEATLAWLDNGNPRQDDAFLDRTAIAFRAIVDAWS